jgi:hypothetical protein
MSLHDSFQKNTDLRNEIFTNNSNLDALLNELKELLQPIQKSKEEEFHAPQWPVGIIVGNPRSGTTLFLQWIASLNVFSYPSNILTRFAYAPYIGALIQEMLFNEKYDYHGDFKDIRSEINFTSDLGKSKGALATNEFQHFFRNYLPNQNLFAEYLDDDILIKSDTNGMQKGLASIESVFDKPFFTKGTFLQFNIDYFYRKIPELFFVMVRREPLFIMQSLLIARERFYGTQKEWWSVKPIEYKFLKKKDIYHQVAGQVYFTEKAILQGLDKVPENRKIIINYEDFCKSPGEFYELLVDKYENLGYSIINPYSGPNYFERKNRLKLSMNELKKLKSAYDEFSNNEV